MAENYELAYADYKAGMKQKEIAAKYDVTINTVKSWQQRKWKKLDEQGTDEKVCTPKKSMHTKKSSAGAKKKAVVKEESLVIENSDLTDKQQLFCIYYVKLFNATKAYQRAYECDYMIANTNGPRLLVNARIKDEIMRLKQHRMNDALFDKHDVLQKYKDIAFADMSEYIGWGYELEPIYDDDGVPLLDDDGNERMYKRSYVYLKNDVEVDSTIVTGVTKGKDGVIIKLGDKMRALDFLAKYTDLLNDNEIKKLRAEEQRMKNIQMERELGGNQHKADPFDSMSVDELEKHLAELGDAE